MFTELADQNDPTKAPASDEGTPVSVKIRERVQAAQQRFHANDNIAAFIEPGELEQLLDEVEHKMQGVLDSLVIDTQDDHNTRNTARRVAKMYLNEVFRGRYVPQPEVTAFPNAEHLNELMIVGPITVRSACSHHLCPVIGKVWIGVLPNKNTNVIGLSKYARLVDWVLGRPQIQEEAIVQLADLIMKKTSPTAWPWCWRHRTFACPGAACARWIRKCSTPSCAASSSPTPPCGASFWRSSRNG